MSTHDLLAYSLASEAVTRIRHRDASAPWATLFSPEVHVTSSRAWPVPDFVVSDTTNRIAAAAEFKPPNQSKREYLTGLGQASAYSMNFDYSILIVPTIADDGYPIAQHIWRVLDQHEFDALPVSLWSYDPAIVSPTVGVFDVLRFPNARGAAPATPASLENSFYAKWREQSPEEVLTYLGYLFDEKRRPTAPAGTIRDRAFDSLWADLQAGRLHHWGGGVRTAANTPAMKVAWLKNYRNFVSHIGWIEGEGLLTDKGFEALKIGSKYGAFSVPFADFMAKSLLIEGKHLVLLRTIYEFQNQHLSRVGNFASDEQWRDLIEEHLEEKGLLKRNPGRAGAAVAGVARSLFKAERQIWRQLQLIVPHGPAGGRAFHPGRGLVIDWTRITDLIKR